MDYIIAPHVFAAQSVLQLSPFLVHEDLERGAELTQPVVVTNNSDTAKFLTLSLNDFLPAGTDGETEILPVNQWAPTQTSLATWITVDRQPQYSLQPGESTQMQITIHVPANAESGAHFGALLFTLGDQVVLPGQTQIRQQSATLFIVDVGRGFEKGEISSFGIAAVGDQTARLQFLSTFHNSGLSSLEPKGKIIISDLFNRPVATAYINPDANIVLPNTDRIFVSQVAGNFWGRYTAVATVTFGSNHLESIVKISFWVWPSAVSIIWGGIYALLLIGVVIFALKKYNAWLRSSRPEASKEEK